MSEHLLQSFFSLLSMSMPPLLPFPLLEESSPYQIQYNKNYQLLRNKYKSKVLPLISFCDVSRVSMILQSCFGYCYIVVHFKKTYIGNHKIAKKNRRLRKRYIVFQYRWLFMKSTTKNSEISSYSSFYHYLNYPTLDP